MAGFSAEPGTAANEDAQLDPQAIPVFDARYELLAGGHESVWLLNAMLQRTAAMEDWHAELGDVSADFLSAFRRWASPSRQGAYDIVVVWRIRTAAPDALEALLLGGSGPWRAAQDVSTHLVDRIDGDVLLIATSAGDANPVHAEIQSWHSPEEAFPQDAAAAHRWLTPPRFEPSPSGLSCAGGPR